MIYLDSAATSFQKPKRVKRGICQALDTCASVGRGGYPAAMEAAQRVYDCRRVAADLFDGEAEQVVFTMNATHGLNLAISSLVPQGGRVVISGFEHNAVTRPLYGKHARIIVAGRALFDPEECLSAFEAALKTKPDVAICTHVSNVFGYILPIVEIARLCKDRGVPLVIDASQSAGVLPVSLRKTGAAFIAMPGHKGLMGPQGTGLLLCNMPGEPLLRGGTGSESKQQSMPQALPERLEAGTLNVCGLAGLLEGLRFVKEQGCGKLLRHEQRLRKHLERELKAHRRFRLFTGSPQTGVLSLQISGTDCEEGAALLAQERIAVRAGLHCAPLAHESAGTLQQGTLRFSFSPFNTEQEVDQLLRVVKKLFPEK